MKNSKFKKSNLYNNIFLVLIIVLIISIIKDPTLAINSAKEGIYNWFNILFPSLFPFFVFSDLLVSLGFVEMFGSLLQPIMKPIFNVPGEGAFPFTISIISGYPVGAKLTSSLRQKNIITRNEANRLITFSSTSGPLFMLGAVLVGMLNIPKLSLLIVLPHYLAIISIGIFFRFYNSGKNNPISKKEISYFQNNNKTDEKPNEGYKSLGLIITNSIKDSMNSIITVGGFVIIYSVIIELFLASKVSSLMMLNISNRINIDSSVLEAIFAGFIELSTGCKKISTLDINLINRIILINFVIAWGGLSVLSQSLSFISQTDINSKLYIFSKFLHGILSSIYTYLLYIIKYKGTTLPVSATPHILKKAYSFNDWISNFLGSTKLAFIICVYFIILSILVHLLYDRKKKRLN